jgi:hypothetical protein
MGAHLFQAGELIAEARLEQSSAKRCHNFSYRNILGAARQRVAACLAANALHKFALPQDSHQFGHVRN